jgi:hypothetical protein
MSRGISLLLPFISPQPDRPDAYINLNRLYTLLGKPDSAELMSRMLQQRHVPPGVR